MAPGQSTPRRVTIPPLHELRLELELGESCSVRLVGGNAEMFGFELLPGQDNPLGREVKAAVFSWTGAEVEMSNISTEYVAEETPVPTYYNAHLALEQLRVSCRPPPSFLPSDDPIRSLHPSQQEDETLGPRVLVVGEAGSGKSTLCKSLINWAVRMGKARRDGDWTDYGEGRKVMFVNLDPADGAFTVPGTFSAAPISSLLPTTTPVHPFGTTHSTSLPPLSQPNPSSSTWEPSPSLNSLAPMSSGISFFYGHTEWGRNDGLTEALFTRLGDVVRRRVEESGDEGLWRGGMVVDTPAEFAKKDKHAMITRCVREFEINVLLVVGNERLHVEMSKLMSTNKTVTVIRVPKNGGASPAEASYKRRLQAAQIRSYFYGGPSISLGSLAPHSMSIRYDVLSCNRVGEETQSLAPMSALPIGHTRMIKDTQLVEVDPELEVGELLNKICALPQIEGERKRREKKIVQEQQQQPLVEAVLMKEKEEEEVKTEGAKTEEAAAEVKKEDEEGTTATTEEEKLKTEPEAEPETVEEEQDFDEEAQHAEDAEIAASPVLGFVHISNADSVRAKYTVLSPLPGKLPRTRLLLGSLEWQET